MLATIPINEMAETLRVLAGANAANAASHFTKRSYARGDAASAVLWSSIAQAIVGAPPAPETQPAPDVPAESEAADPLPIREISEDTAFQDVWYEDVDAGTIANEDLPEVTVAAGIEDADPPECIGVSRAGGPAAPIALDAMTAETSDLGLPQAA